MEAPKSVESARFTEQEMRDMAESRARSALICGSMAFDTIMVFQDRFKNHILPDKIHMLNVSFLVPQMRREFGGCASNIAYNLALLGDRGYPMATVGQDFGSYTEWMKRTRETEDDYSRLIAFFKMMSKSNCTPREIEEFMDPQAVLKLAAVRGVIGGL